MELKQTLFRIFTGLNTAIGERARTSHTEFLTRVFRRLSRMIARLNALLDKWHAGTLPKPRPSRAGKPRKHTPQEKPALPRSPAWLCKFVPSDWTHHGCAAFGSQLLHLIETSEDFKRFLEAAPQAKKILRPLLNTIYPTLPECLRLPPRPARPKPDPKPQKPRIEIRRRYEIVAPYREIPRKFYLQVPGLKKSEL